MSVLPNSNTGDPNLDDLFRLIDERLSELYSIHGQQSPRAGLKTSLTTGGSIEGSDGEPVVADRSNRGVQVGTGALFGPTATATISTSGFRPQTGTLYRQSIPIAWGVWGGSNGLLSSFNLTATAAFPGGSSGTNIVYRIISNVPNSPTFGIRTVAPVATLYDTFFTTNLWYSLIISQALASKVFVVTTYSSHHSAAGSIIHWARRDLPHNVVVMGFH